MSIDILKLSIRQAHEAMKAGEFSPTLLLEACLKNIKEKDGEIHAFLEVFEESAREEAKIADKKFKEGRTGILCGIPIAVKDNILIKGKIVSAASKILENYRAAYDATVIKKLKEEGVVFVGRTNLDEFAMGASTENSAYGPTRNPHDIARVSGGSSGGSAAAVAAGMCLFALGSDTGGSIRQPASFCGVVGAKPTYGSVSRHGLIALGSSLDVIGPIAKYADDAEIIFNIIKGKDILDSTTIEKKDESEREKKKTIGIPTKFLESGGLSEDVLLNFKIAREKFEKLGYKIKEIDLPNAKYSVPTYYILLPAEASTNLARYDGVKFGLLKEGDNLLGDYQNTRGAGFGKEVRRRILIGTYVLSAGYYDAYYNKANKIRSLISKDYKKAFLDVDFVLTPTAPDCAFKVGEKSSDPIKMYLEDIFTSPANLAGLPAISLPNGTIKSGEKDMPMGIQLVAPKLEEDSLFEISKEFLGEFR